MTTQSSGKRLAAILWFVAAGLAAVALAIGFVSDRGPKFSVVAGGLFSLVMGIMTLRSQKPPSR